MFVRRGRKVVVPIHVHIVAAKVEGDKELEDEGMLWVRRREITE